MTYIRMCPQCKKELKYKHKCSWKKAIQKNIVCRNCSHKNLCKTEEQKKKMASHFGKPRKGKNNPFYGKKHSNKTKKHLSRICPKYGKDNGMYGKKLYDVWLEKYGEQEANNRLIKLGNKHSKNNSGENNPMFGKPSPQGSGNGWSGWYGDWYFRSLRELSYVVNYLEKNELKWESAEKKKFTIPYIDYDGTRRTYRPDFFVEDKKLVEIKPNKLKKATTNNLKKQAAEKFCKKNNYEYEIIEPKRMGEAQIIGLYQRGLIKFIERYEKKFKEKYLNGEKD